MPTLILSSKKIHACQALAEVARQDRWDVAFFDVDAPRQPRGRVVFYGGTDKAMEIAIRHGLSLLEPPFELLPALPFEFRLRAVELARFGDLNRLKAPAFLKPADALNKAFDAGIYSSARDIREHSRIADFTPILVAEPVEWTAEFRCFVLEGRIAAWSPYLSFGRPNWKQFALNDRELPLPAHLEMFCDRLFSKSRGALPPAVVMDVGLIEDRGWAVVEFNPVWCSGLLGANPRKVLAVLVRACQDSSTISDSDRAWVRTNYDTVPLEDRLP